jgi:transposase
LGFADETWWSRFTQPRLHAWSEADRPLHLVEQVRQKEDADPKALACYGVLMRWRRPEAATKEEIWLRFVDGRPVSVITIQFLEWRCRKLQELGFRVWALVWDNASWHRSVKVRGWIREHNREVKEMGAGVRILVCPLPIKSPWLNPIEPRWVHGKKRIAEPARTLSAQEVAERVCTALNCHHEPHLSIPENAP